MHHSGCEQLSQRWQLAPEALRAWVDERDILRVSP
jgi:hypothetical protein